MNARPATNNLIRAAPAPVPSAERVVPIDVIRGVALAGVLLVNLVTDFRTPLSANILGQHEPYGWGGTLALPIFRSLIEFKAITLFSFLFGVGVAIQAERVSSQQRIRFFVRRFTALLAIGLIHILFIWNGDILTLYALCGLVLIPLLRLPEYVLFVLGLGLIVWPNMAPFPAAFPTTATLKALAAGALHAYGKGTWPEIFAYRMRETRLLIVPLLMLSLPRTLGLMLWGIGTWRKGWMENNPRWWRWAAILGATLGIAGQRLGIGEAETIGLALVYAAVLLLWNPYVPWIAAAGRMALTNYLLQSVIFGFVFYSYGLGLYGRIGVVATLLGGVFVYCIQLAMSDWWLKRFRFGPCEWVWRSVSYLQWQRLVHQNHLTVSRTAAGRR
jgi:uncharacterized protein